jgi:DNA (cytosine-5)-methyltransferase 1
MNKPKVFWIDLFSGAGGTSTGVHLANKNATVVACVNHDKKAIESHYENHKDCKHFTEDIRDFQVVLKLKKIVDDLREKYPNCYINIWASLECTNYSKAKGGLPRDGDSRTLANHLFMYLEELNPDYLYIENVREFMAWGPLDEKGRPISMKKGIDYIKWTEEVMSHGYKYNYKLLNAADFNAYTSRIRYFGVFAKPNLPIEFPKPTNYDPRKGNPNTGMFGGELKPWNAVKEILDLDNKGRSIFLRKKPLVDSTLERIYAGLIKFVADGDDSFLKKYYSGRPKGKVTSVNMPCGSVTTSGALGLVQTEFLTSYYGNGQAHSANRPSPTVGTKDTLAVNYILYDYSSFTATGIDQPAGTITVTPKHNLVTNEWITDTQYGRVGRSIDMPSYTLIASMGKKPMYLVSSENGLNCKSDMSGFLTEKCKEILNTEIGPAEKDTVQLRILKFMALYGISDVKMRMLIVPELKSIQGFPKDYILLGTQTEQKKFIGNSVEVNQARALVNANYESLKQR